MRQAAEGGQLTVPNEVVEPSELERRELMKVYIQVDEWSPIRSYLNNCRG